MEGKAKTEAFYNWAGMRSKTDDASLKKGREEGFGAGWDAAMKEAERRLIAMLRRAGD